MIGGADLRERTGLTSNEEIFENFAPLMMVGKESVNLIRIRQELIMEEICMGRKKRWKLIELNLE